MIAGRLKTGSLILGLLLALGLTTSAFAAGKSYTGTVSDAMCGAKHAMPDAATCTRGCVGKGSKYALVVGDKVYTLETTDKSALATAIDKASISPPKRNRLSGTLNMTFLRVSLAL